MKAGSPSKPPVRDGLHMPFRYLIRPQLLIHSSPDPLGGDGFSPNASATRRSLNHADREHGSFPRRLLTSSPQLPGGTLRGAVKGSPAAEAPASSAVARNEEARCCREKGGRSCSG